MDVALNLLSVLKLLVEPTSPSPKCPFTSRSEIRESRLTRSSPSFPEPIGYEVLSREKSFEILTSLLPSLLCLVHAHIASFQEWTLLVSKHTPSHKNNANPLYTLPPNESSPNTKPPVTLGLGNL